MFKKLNKYQLPCIRVCIEYYSTIYYTLLRSGPGQNADSKFRNPDTAVSYHLRLCTINIPSKISLSQHADRQAHSATHVFYRCCHLEALLSER